MPNSGSGSGTMTLESLAEKIESNIRDARNQMHADMLRIEDRFTKWQEGQDTRLHEHEKMLSAHDSLFARLGERISGHTMLVTMVGAGLTALGGVILIYLKLRG